MSYFEVLVRRLVSSMCVISLCCGASSLAFADASSASLSITVSDTSGAVIPDAKAVLRNSDTDQQQTSASNRSGNTSFQFLKPGRYTLTVSKDGFSDVSVAGILLNVGDERQLQLVLKVGEASQDVTVDGSGLTINTTDGSASTVVDRQFVENMPLNGRSFQDLIELTPGVVTQSPQSGGTTGQNGEFSVNGQRTESNVYTVDGVNANSGGYTSGVATSGTSGSLPTATALGTTQSLASVDDLQEFRVNSSSYSAEYGLSPGGQFAFQTRSGTNELHGTVFDYLRNDTLDANNWFNNYTTPITRKTAERQNDFGGTFGGPLFIPRVYNGKDKSFLFVSYEGLRLAEPQAALTTYVPSTALRQAAPAVLQPVLNAFPVATGAPLSNGLAPFTGAYSLPSSVDSISVRLDQQFNPRVRIFDRFSDTQSTNESRYYRGLSELDTSSQSDYSNTTGLTSIISPAITNEFRMNYTASTGSASDQLDNYGGATPANLLQLQSIDTTANPEAGVEFALYFAGYKAALSQGPAIQPQHAWNLNDSTTFAYGQHALKVGIDYRRILSKLAPSTPFVLSEFTTSAGVTSNVSAAGEVVALATSYPAYTNFAVYV